MNPQLGRLGSVSPSLLNGGSAKPIFRGDLVDFFTFKGKGNIDLDRNIIIGLLDNKLTAYNFVWSLMSGYGGYNENYLTYSKVENVFVTDDHSITIMNFVLDNRWVAYKYGNSALKSTKIKVAGLTSDDQLEYGYSPSNEGARVMMPIPKDGIYDLPESVVNQSTYNIGFFLRSALTKNVTIEQIPLYEGAIVTDGVDDYLKLDKVGYKIGTIIVKYKFLSPEKLGWQYIFDTKNTRNYLAYEYRSAISQQVLLDNFNNRGDIGDYHFISLDGPRNVTTPLYIAASSNITDYMSMALYSIAIYSAALSEEDVQKEISEAFPKYEQLILNR
jgi:hypothetical protein